MHIWEKSRSLTFYFLFFLLPLPFSFAIPLPFFSFHLLSFRYRWVRIIAEYTPLIAFCCVLSDWSQSFSVLLNWPPCPYTSFPFPSFFFCSFLFFCTLLFFSFPFPSLLLPFPFLLPFPSLLFHFSLIFFPGPKILPPLGKNYRRIYTPESFIVRISNNLGTNIE